LTFAYVLFDGEINKDLLDRLTLDARHSEPPEVNVAGLLGKPLPIARDWAADRQCVRANAKCAGELRKSTLTDAGLIACQKPA
jgi:hypothetical protein